MSNKITNLGVLEFLARLMVLADQQAHEDPGRRDHQVVLLQLCLWVGRHNLVSP